MLFRAPPAAAAGGADVDAGTAEGAAFTDAAATGLVTAATEAGVTAGVVANGGGVAFGPFTLASAAQGLQ